MKRSFWIVPVTAILSLCLACGGGAPQAEQANTQPPVAEATDAPRDTLWEDLDASAPFTADLNGDGTEETIQIHMDDDAYTTTVTVTGAAGTYADVIDCALHYPACYHGDVIAGDGYTELFLTGDAGSVDYETFIYRLTARGLRRADMREGRVLGISGDGSIRFSVVVNVLGTYDALCDYEMDGYMGLVQRTGYTITEYDGLWDDRKLTLQRDGFSPTRAGAGEAAPVRMDAGTELLLTYVDMGPDPFVVLTGKDGTAYNAHISPDTEAGWGWLVEGEPESCWFNELHYAG